MNPTPQAAPVAPEQSLELRCKDCGATLTLPATQFAAVCPYCASGSVVDRPVDPQGARRERPDFILGFHVPSAVAVERVRAWLARRRFFSPNAVRQAEVTSTRGIYLPAWIYSAVARTRYRATIGENYTETETYTTTDAKGNTVTRTRTVVRTEYRKLAGEHAMYTGDLVVTASRGLPNDELETIEPFDLGALRRYDPAIVSGWAAEEATLDRREGRRIAHAEALDLIDRELRRFMPGDSSTVDDFDTELSDENTDLVMLPVWVFAARYTSRGEERTLRILVNGQTGEVQGDVPRSAVKITLAVLLGLAAVFLIVLIVMTMAGGGPLGLYSSAGSTAGWSPSDRGVESPAWSVTPATVLPLPVRHSDATDLEVTA